VVADAGTPRLEDWEGAHMTFPGASIRILTTRDSAASVARPLGVCVLVAAASAPLIATSALYAASRSPQCPR